LGIIIVVLVILLIFLGFYFLRSFATEKGKKLA
ncbi:unnamed protein product, partial [marine sediment metagenome]